MIPGWYGGRGSGEIVLYPTDVDEDGVMHSNTAFGDYPMYLPGVKPDAVNNGFTGWMLLSHKKHVEVSHLPWKVLMLPTRLTRTS